MSSGCHEELNTPLGDTQEEDSAVEAGPDFGSEEVDVVEISFGR